MSTFTYTPDYTASVAHNPRLIKATFGDGYVQRAQDGINPDLKVWTLQFSNRTSAEGNAINSFLAGLKGVDSFTWTDPDGATLSYVCESWNKSHPQYDAVTVSCTFIQTLT